MAMLNNQMVANQQTTTWDRPGMFVANSHYLLKL